MNDPLSRRWAFVALAVLAVVTAGLSIALLQRPHASVPLAGSNAATAAEGTTGSSMQSDVSQERDPGAAMTAQPSPTRRSLAAARRPAADLPVLLEGRVVDDVGAPVEDFEWNVEAPYGVSLQANEPSKELEATRHRMSEFRRATHLRPQRGDGGRFVVRGETPGKTLRVSVWHPRFEARLNAYRDPLPQPWKTHATFPVGTHDARVVLTRVGHVRTTVLHAADVESRHLDLTLVRGSDARLMEALFSEDARQRDYRAMEVPVGTYDLRIATTAERTLLVIPAITVPPDAWCADPRLHEIDLRWLWRTVVVRFRDADHRPLSVFDLPELEVEARRPDGSELPLERVKKSELHIDLTDRQIELRIRSPRYRSVHLPAVRDDITVVLQPRPLVELRPGSPLRAELPLRLIPDGGGADPIPVVLTGAPVRVRLPDVGRYALAPADGDPRTVAPTAIDVVGDFLAVDVVVQAR